MYQPAGKFIERLFAYIAFMLQGGRVQVPLLVQVPDNDGESKLTVSSTSTKTDNPSTGRIIDKYIYQVLGRMLERCAGRIAMSTYLSANTIRRTIEGMWYNVEIKEPCYVCQAASVRQMSVEEKVRMAASAKLHSRHRTLCPAMHHCNPTRAGRIFRAPYGHL